MSLQRKKVTVRTKRGKVYQRSVMVKSGVKASLRKHGAYAFVNGVTSGLVGGGTAHAIWAHRDTESGYQLNRRITLSGAIAGSGASMITSEVLNRKTRAGRRLVRDMSRMTLWERAALGAVSVVGGAAGWAVADRAANWAHRDTDRHVAVALLRSARAKRVQGQ